MNAEGLQSFLIYLASLKVSRQGRLYVFQSVKEAEDFLTHLETSEDSALMTISTDATSGRPCTGKPGFEVLSASGIYLDELNYK
ncbi:UNVERIFIED_CONTAM: hypothetical protein FKN15_032242 [Acipenser sinensis]